MPKLNRFRIKDVGNGQLAIVAVYYNLEEGTIMSTDRDINITGTREQILIAVNELAHAFGMPVLPNTNRNMWDPAILGASGVPEDLKEGPEARGEK